MELERYINSRGTIYDGKFSPSLLTIIFRNQKLTLHKVQSAQDLISQIRDAQSLPEIQELVQKADKNDSKLKQKTFYSGLEYSMGKCIAMAETAQNDEASLDYDSASRKSL